MTTRSEDKWKRSLKISDLKVRKGKGAKQTQPHRVRNAYTRKGKNAWQDNE